MGMVVSKKVYEVWTQGTIGLNEGKFILFGVFDDHQEALKIMISFLKEKKIAFIKTKDAKSDKIVEDFPWLEIR